MKPPLHHDSEDPRVRFAAERAVLARIRAGLARMLYLVNLPRPVASPFRRRQCMPYTAWRINQDEIASDFVTSRDTPVAQVDILPSVAPSISNALLKPPVASPHRYCLK